MTKFWMARDKSGKLKLFANKPRRYKDVSKWKWKRSWFYLDPNISIGKGLTWEDEPREVALCDPKTHVVVEREKQSKQNKAVLIANRILKHVDTDKETKFVVIDEDNWNTICIALEEASKHIKIKTISIKTLIVNEVIK